MDKIRVKLVEIHSYITYSQYSEDEEYKNHLDSVTDYEEVTQEEYEALKKKFEAKS